MNCTKKKYNKGKLSDFEMNIKFVKSLMNIFVTISVFINEFAGMKI